MSDFKRAIKLYVLAIVCGIRQFVQVAPDCGLGFLLLGPGNSIEACRASSDIGIASKEIYGASPKTKKLCDDGVIVLFFGNMAIGAVLRRPNAARCMREMWVEGLSATL
jgi:hypothetical protein